MFLTGRVRYDGNSSFGKSFKGVFYPGVGLSWLMSDESFFPHPSWLNSFRSRATYGASGVQPSTTAAARFFSSTTATIARHRSAGRAARRARQREAQAGVLGRVRDRLRRDDVQQPNDVRVHVLQQEDEGRDHLSSDRAVDRRYHVDLRQPRFDPEPGHGGHVQQPGDRQQRVRVRASSSPARRTRTASSRSARA